tara:strand:+ start:761 stop:1378 length:618 start_codon:yes stop_codon:yes gene_type:complete
MRKALRLLLLSAAIGTSTSASADELRANLGLNDSQEPTDSQKPTDSQEPAGLFPLQVSEQELRGSVGLNDSLGPVGLFTVQLSDQERFGDFFFAMGTTMVVISGVGIGWQRHFGDGLFAPYVTSTAFTMIGLPAMCQTDHCSIKFFPMVSASGGIELRSRREEKTNFHLQLGLWSAYNFGRMEVFESPSDRPYIWPVVNVGWTRL